MHQNCSWKHVYNYLNRNNTWTVWKQCDLLILNSLETVWFIDFEQFGNSVIYWFLLLTRLRARKHRPLLVSVGQGTFHLLYLTTWSLPRVVHSSPTRCFDLDGGLTQRSLPLFLVYCLTLPLWLFYLTTICEQWKKYMSIDWSMKY